jgi:phenylalanyl-tRNA synthetase beta chain
VKVSLSWLRDHLDTDASPTTIADTLTAIGLEVEGLSNPAQALAPFRVAEVVACEKHPQADKLQVLRVEFGEGPVQVVCGAPNARAGMRGVFGPPGSTIPATGLVLKSAAIRGVESHGMMCSARELQLGDDHDGIIELPADATVGAAYASWAGLDDPVFEINVTPNRGDCMGVRGIARDLAAAGLGSLKPLKIPHVEGSFPSPVAIRIEDSEGCPAFFGRAIRGLRNGASPPWMQRRLQSAGQRPISAIVDITNYLMLDLGRPSHAYDTARLKGALVGRRARDGERVLALNEREYRLDPEITVIADERQVHDVGGIMGGEHSGVSDSTTEVMLEVAFFDPQRIARTGQKLGLSSDARTRFERGVDPAFLGDGLAILTGLILEICGGEASDEIRVGTPPVEGRSIPFDPQRTEQLGGIAIPEERQRAILLSLGFALKGSEVEVPSWRRDVEGPADLVEEITRIEGFDRVPPASLPRAEGVARPTATRAQIVERRVRRTAAARGLHEAVTWSFVSEKEASLFGGSDWRLANPISEELKVMRPSLLPGLMAAATRNLNRGLETVRLFELGRRYLAEGEHPTVALLLAGDRSTRDWQTGGAQPFSAFDAKAEALALLEAAGAPAASLQVVPDAGPVWHPGRSATLRLGPKTLVAAFGELHPALVRDLDAPPGCVAAEIYLDAVPAGKGGGRARPAYAPPALQAVRRDFAFLVPPDLPAEALLRAVRGADKQAIAAVRLFDRYQPEGGDLSLALEVVLQPTEKTFTDAEIAAISKRVVVAAEKLGARLRA